MHCTQNAAKTTGPCKKHAESVSQLTRNHTSHTYLGYLNLLLDVHVVRLRVPDGINRIALDGAQRLDGQLPLAHDLQLAGPISLVHGAKFVASAAHPIGAHSWLW